MRLTWQKPVLLAVAVLAFGGLRLPFEAGLQRELRAAGLFPPVMDIAARDRIDQTSSAVALGGLRTLVATFLNLRAYTAFSERRWEELAETYDTIVNLAPRTRYYWDAGAWHLAYNAASHFLNDSDLPPLRRREAWRSYIFRGRAFLERGIRNNPLDWRLHAALGALLSDANKFPAFPDAQATFAAAAAAYGRAVATGEAPAFVHRARLYALARVEGRESEALALARELYARGPEQRTPTLLMVLLVLEADENRSLDVARRAVELFGSPPRAYAALTGHWQRTRERFPVTGVAAGIQSLEQSLAIPAEKSILLQALPPPPDPDEWFRE